MEIKEFLRKAFLDNRWLCAYRILYNDELPQKDKKYQYHLVEVPKKYWIADPFLFEKDNETYLFFEYMDRYKAKAILGMKRILPQEEKSITPIYEFDCHTSYPCVFKWKEKIYITPETIADHKLELLCCDTWPYRWKRIGTLLDGIDVADCTPFEWNGKLYILIYEIPASKEIRQLYIGELDVLNCKIGNLRCVKQYSKNAGRPGGNVINKGGQLIRMVQPALVHYGEKIEMYKFYFDDTAFYEEKINEYVPEQVKLDKHIAFDRMHTFNRSRNVEVIDVLTKNKIHPFKPIMIILQMLSVQGFDLCDKRKKFINGRRPLQNS